MAIGFWTVEKTEALEQLWAAGLSASEVGKHIGASRSATLGKLWRLGVKPPAGKKPFAINRIYVRQPIEITRANARERNKRYRFKIREVRRTSLDTNAAARDRLLSLGVSPSSPIYRRQLPKLQEMTKGELRAMLAQAFQNTAAL